MEGQDKRFLGGLPEDRLDQRAGGGMGQGECCSSPREGGQRAERSACSVSLLFLSMILIPDNAASWLERDLLRSTNILLTSVKDGPPVVDLALTLLTGSTDALIASMESLFPESAKIIFASFSGASWVREEPATAKSFAMEPTTWWA